jgi:hypothetical protein
VRIRRPPPDLVDTVTLLRGDDCRARLFKDREAERAGSYDPAVAVVRVLATSLRIAAGIAHASRSSHDDA